MLFVNSIEAKVGGVKRERARKGEELTEAAEGKTQRGKIQRRTHPWAKGVTPTVVMWAWPHLSFVILCKYYRLMFVLLLLSLLLLRGKKLSICNSKNPTHTEKKEHTHTLEASSLRDEASNKKKIFFNSDARNHSQ